MIELSVLNEFKEFCQCGTLSAAAEKLHTSQPALSRSMQKLEENIGVPIFNRNKNKLTLNETGRLLLQYAEKLLAMEQEMTEHIQAFDLNMRTIMFGSCALTPQREFTALLRRIYPENMVRSAIGTEKELLQGLEKDLYSFVVLTNPVTDDNYICKRWYEEHLFASVTPTHHFAHRTELTLAELDGSNILIYSDIGFWHTMLKSKMPNSQFVVHNDYDILNYLMGAVEWPVFQTNFTLHTRPSLDSRIDIPVTDKEANVTYYCVCKKNNYNKISKLLGKL